MYIGLIYYLLVLSSNISSAKMNVVPIPRKTDRIGMKFLITAPSEFKQMHVSMSPDSVDLPHLLHLLNRSAHRKRHSCLSATEVDRTQFSWLLRYQPGCLIATKTLYPNITIFIRKKKYK